MITFIYAVESAEEARNIAKLGADCIGVNVGIRKEWSTILTPEKANEVLSGVIKPSKKVLLTISNNLNDIREIISRVEFDILHLIAEPSKLIPENVYELKKSAPKLQIMRTIPVTGEESINIAKQYEGIADYLLLDSRSVKTGLIGATGETHDWEISRRIVASVSIPVVLAGGLGPDNVAKAIKKVHPYGVDSKTKTNKSGSRGKDLEKVRQFIQIAKATK